MTCRCLQAFQQLGFFLDFLPNHLVWFLKWNQYIKNHVNSFFKKTVHCTCRIYHSMIMRSRLAFWGFLTTPYNQHLKGKIIERSIRKQENCNGGSQPSTVNHEEAKNSSATERGRSLYPVTYSLLQKATSACQITIHSLSVASHCSAPRLRIRNHPPSTLPLLSPKPLEYRQRTIWHEVLERRQSVWLIPQRHLDSGREVGCACTCVI